MILGLLGLLIGIKFLVLFILGRFFSLRGGQNTLFSFSLAQGGEFAFVLVSFSLDNGVVTDQVSDILFVVVALSMAVTPLLLLFNDRVVQPRVEKTGLERDHDVVEEKDNPVIIAGFDDFGVVIGRFLIANGIKVTILDDNPDNIDVLKKFGFKVYYGDASRGDLLKAAGGKNASVIVVAVSDKQKSLRIIDQVERNYPNLKVLARAMDMDHTYDLIRRKVDEFDSDTFESSLQLGMKVLTSLGYQKYRAYRLGRIFRRHNHEVIRDLCKHHGEDEIKYLSEAKKHALEVEEILRAEQEDTSYQDDHSWDDTPRREESLDLLDRGK
jgi:voltage-gated potassium channel Kch